MPTANSIAIAGGAISSAVLTALVKKVVLTKEEALVALNSAQRQLGPFIQSGGPDAVDAARLIGNTILALNKDGA